MNERAEIGGNNPPSQIEFSQETVKALSVWMTDHPTIQSEDDAREAKLLVDRGKACSKDLVDERQAQTGPLLKEVEDIRAKYRAPAGILDKVLTELEARLRAFIIREEERRKKIAEEKRLAAEKAEREAREKEAAEQAAKEEAKVGVLDVDIGTTTIEADEAFSRFKTAKREADLAEKESAVKIGGGFRRATSLRTKELLTVDDWVKAINYIGLTESIRDAILTEARALRSALGELPPGISSHKERG